jgi:cytidine deaminase
MKEYQHQFNYYVYSSAAELEEEDAWLLRQAQEATANAYAPYSNFLVGAAAKLANNQVVTGSNQENASFPAGLCAERVLLAAVASIYPNIAIHTLAISYNNVYGNSNIPITPCGVCRQSLQEFEGRYQQPVRLILAGLTGEVYALSSASLLLPFAFNSTILSNKPDDASV